MAMCPDGGLLMLGPAVYRKRGYMHRKYKKLLGNDDGDGHLLVCAVGGDEPAAPAAVVDEGGGR